MPRSDTERHRSAVQSGTPTGTSARRALRGFQKGSFDSGRDINSDEAISGEQVVLSALVDDAEVPVPLGVLVREDDIDLVALERRLVPAVVDTDSELPAGRARLARPSRGTPCA